ncbi:MAG: sugar ABC transporter ATP-binding protein [Chloroflexi bacterium]|nr:sugar ABC transporter ATP-binding protein [Chloroflexota bacterium]
MEPPSILEVRHLRISFRSVQALADVSLKVRMGEIHAVLGQNGAGKTTLMKILGGFSPAKAYQGEIIIAGQPVVLSTPHQAVRNGMAIVPRRPSVFPNLSVAENIGMGQWKAGRTFAINGNAVRRRAEGTLRELGVTLNLDAGVGELDAGQRRLVAIARAVSGRPRLIILDEPAMYATAPAEISQLIRILRLLADQNIASLYLTPNPEEAMGVADRITVLRDGTVAGTFERINFDAATLAMAMISNQPGRGAGMDNDEEIDGVGGIFRVLRFLGLDSRR